MTTILPMAHQHIAKGLLLFRIVIIAYKAKNSFGQLISLAGVVQFATYILFLAHS